MRLSAEATYAMRALFDIAYHAGGGPTKADQIARREEIPGKFLEQILRKLKRAELVSSRRGPKGGYSLAKAPQDITIGAIIRATEGSSGRACCFETDSVDAGGREHASRAVTSATWAELAGRINALLETVTVADMIERAQRSGVQRAGLRSFVYVI